MTSGCTGFATTDEANGGACEPSARVSNQTSPQAPALVHRDGTPRGLQEGGAHSRCDRGRYTVDRPRWTVRTGCSAILGLESAAMREPANGVEALEALDAMTPNERAAAVRSSIVTDPAEVPVETWSQIEQTAARIGEQLRAR